MSDDPYKLADDHWQGEGDPAQPAPAPAVGLPSPQTQPQGAVPPPGTYLGPGQWQPRPLPTQSQVGGCGRAVAILAAVGHLLAIPLWIFSAPLVRELHHVAGHVGTDIGLLLLGVCAVLLLIVSILAAALSRGVPRAGGVFGLLATVGALAYLGLVLFGLAGSLMIVMLIAGCVHLVAAILLFFPPPRH